MFPKNSVALEVGRLANISGLMQRSDTQYVDIMKHVTKIRRRSYYINYNM